jgi:hypothetical protein
MRSSSEGLFGQEAERWYRDAPAFFERARAFDIGAVVAVEPRLASFHQRKLSIENIQL